MPTDSHPEIVPTSVQDVQAALTESLAVPSATPAASAPPTVEEIPELEEVRRVHGETGVAQVLEAVQQVHAHVTAELDKRRELIPEWEDSTTCALELPEVVKDEQIEHFRWHGTAAELRRWRDHWRAHVAAARRRATDRAERDEPETSRPTQPRRRPVPRIDPAEIRPMGLHAAKRLLERFVD